MEQEIEQLARQTEATLALVQEVLVWQKQQDELRKLNRQLARYTHSPGSVKAEVDEAAFVLVYQADRMVDDVNTKNTAIENYKNVIKYFPDNKWAETARQRLKKIQQNNQSNHI